MIMSRSRVVQNYTEIGSPILDDQIGEVLVFTAQSYAHGGLCCRAVSVRLSICLFVTLVYCIETAITITRFS